MTYKSPPPPGDMNQREIETERLYYRLKNMGLYVSPIFVDGEYDSLLVAIDAPSCTPIDAAQAPCIGKSMATKVTEDIKTTNSNENNIVDFPSGA